jgi:hypothetical protein
MGKLARGRSRYSMEYIAYSHPFCSLVRWVPAMVRQQVTLLAGNAPR